MELLRELAHFGLSEKEGMVYLASLELGPAPVQDISHKAKVNRATTYVMVESLMGRGLMSSFVRGKKRFYASETPERLRALLRSQRRELEMREEELEKVFPMLSALYNAEGAKPQVRYLEGMEGIQTVREIFRKLEGEIIEFAPFDPAMTPVELEEGREEHARELLEKKVPYRALVAVDDADRSKIPSIPGVEVRAIPRQQFPTNAEITVRGNTVCLYSFKSAILAVVITSKEIADGFRSLFELAWEAAGKRS
jgi:sugar-specific transcriptional regulator TrmB